MLMADVCCRRDCREGHVCRHDRGNRRHRGRCSCHHHCRHHPAGTAAEATEAQEQVRRVDLAGVPRDVTVVSRYVVLWCRINYVWGWYKRFFFGGGLAERVTGEDRDMWY